MIWQNTFNGRIDEPDYAKEVFRTHNQAVIDSFPADRVLVFQAKDGWEPLCAFLDVDVPAEPYPHLNDTAEMQSRIKLLKALNWLPWIVGSALIAFIGWRMLS